MDKSKKHLNERVFVYAGIWTMSYIGSLFALKTLSIPREAGIVITIVPVLAFALFLYKFYRSIYFMDEVEIKIQMEAAVLAFSLGLILLMTLGLLDLVQALDQTNWSYRQLIPVLIIFYFAGLFISRRKYKFGYEKYD